LLNLFIRDFDGLSGKVGWFESAKYPKGTPVALVAAHHEFGSAKAGRPPKSFFRPAVAENQKTWESLSRRFSKEVLEGGLTAHQAMSRISLTALADVKTAITELGNYAESDRVVKRRRRRKDPPPNESTAILRDTMRLFTTLTQVTEKK
jgi:hypothetical protein